MRPGLFKAAKADSEAENTVWVRVTNCLGKQEASQWQRVCVGGRERATALNAMQWFPPEGLHLLWVPLEPSPRAAAEF